MSSSKGAELADRIKKRRQPADSSHPGSGVSQNSPEKAPKAQRTSEHGEPSSNPLAIVPAPPPPPPPVPVVRPPTNQHEPRPIPRLATAEAAPAALIESLRASRRLGPMLKLNQVFNRFTQVSLRHSYIARSLAESFADAFESALLNKRHRRMDEVQTLKNAAIRVLTDVIGRALYMRLYYLSKLAGHNPAPFQNRPTFNNQTLLPAPIARAISCIGTFRPAGVTPDVMYFPSYDADPGHSGGSQVMSLLPSYIALETEFRELEFIMSRVETKQREGTSWYLLPVEEQYAGAAIYDVLSNFPPQCGNITDTDAITRAFALRPDQTGVVRSRLYNEALFGHGFGTILRDIRPHEPYIYMSGDLGIPSELYLQALVNI